MNDPTRQQSPSRTGASVDLQVWSMDLASGDVSWTEQLFRLFGLSPEHGPPSYEKHGSLFTGESWARLQAAVTLAITEGTAYNMTLVFVTADGGQRLGRAQGSPTFDIAGQVAGLTGTFQDITSQHEPGRAHRLEHALRARTTELERSNEALKQFAYAASHDLQEPLRGIAGCAQILQRRYRRHLDDEADELLDHMVASASRMKTLIRDLLTLSQVGAEPVDVESLDPGRSAVAALALLTTAIEGADATIEIEPNMPRVLADDSALVTLFQNLIANAVKYRGSAAPWIRVRAIPRGAEIEIIVADNGIGIPEEFRERVFEIFQRLHGRQEYPGTGIGLTLCRRIVERLGGRIQIGAPEHGPGTAIHFSLPAAP